MEPMDNPKKIYNNFVGFMRTKDYATESVKEELERGMAKFDEKEEPQIEETFEIKFYRKTICIRFNKEDDDEKRMDKVKRIIIFWKKVLSDAKWGQTKKLEHMLTRETLKLSDKLITNLEFSLKEEKNKEILDKWWHKRRMVLLFDLIYRCPKTWFNTRNPSLPKEIFSKKKDQKLDGIPMEKRERARQFNMENRGRVRMRIREIWSKIDRREEFDEIKYIFPELNAKQEREMRKMFKMEEKLLEEDISSFETKVLRDTEKEFREGDRQNCRECPLSFSSTNTRWQHESSKHEGKLHTCEICKTKVATVGNLRRHEKIHNKTIKYQNKIEEKLRKTPTMVDIICLFDRTKEDVIQTIKKKSSKQPSMLELLELHNKAEKSEQRLTNKKPTRSGGVMNVIQDLSRDMRIQDRKRQAENESEKTKDQIKLRNRLARAKSRAKMSKEEKERVARQDKLRRDRNKMRKRRMKEEGKQKQTNMETGEIDVDVMQL